jgi:hypothetical protein
MSILRLYNVDDRKIYEYGAVGGMIIGRGYLLSVYFYGNV